MKKPRIICGYQNTKLNNEDFAITPYLFGVWKMFVIVRIIRIIGIGLCWGHHAFYIAIGTGIPKNYPTFKNLSIKN